jgi:hypothetical protein
MQLTNVFFCFVLVVFYGAIATGEGSAFERKYPSVTFLAPLAIFSVALPLYIGVKIYVKLYAPYLLAVNGREYTNVPPTARTAEYADAGILRFTDDAALDTSRSFGLKLDDFTYCVAPVVSRNIEVHPTSSGPKVTFWAVGKDCCGSRREFECDGAGETEVRSAFTVRDIDHNFVTKTLVPKTSRPKYLLAVDAAKAMHNLKSESDEKIILVRWAADPKDTLQVWSQRAQIAVAVSCMLYSVCVTILWSFIHWWFDSDIRRMVGLKDFGGVGQNPNRQVKDPFMLGTGA